MMRLSAGFCSAVLSLIICFCSGCFPASDRHVDEEKDPHYQRGRSLVSSQDYKGAVEEFEKALETNPRSAAAHFELGWLYDDKIKSFASAIYHYERYLSLRKEGERAGLIRGRITLCKRELANTEFPLPNSENLQRDVERLSADNALLKQRIEVLTAQLSAVTSAQARVDSYRTTAVMPPPTAPNFPVSTSAPPSTTYKPSAPQTTHTQTARPRVHVVKPGETMGAIASQYGLKLSALHSANPTVDAKKLRIGQTLKLP